MIELEAGHLRARVAPEAGGMIAALDWQGPDGRRHRLLRAQDGRQVAGETPKFGSWMMVPFANRAFEGIVDDGQRRIRVERNDPRGTIHGFGWQCAWDILRQDRSHTILEHRRRAGPDPYRYRATQAISLDEAGMTIAIAVTNEADAALPYGLGHHPWFDCAADTRLGMTAKGTLVFGEHYRATGSLDLPDGGVYAGMPVFATGSETAWSFLGWDGTARIETPSAGLAITLTASESLGFPVVWAPAGADFLCVEPQSHAIGSPSEAPARKVSPLTRLEPGETLEGWLRIAPEAI